MGRSSGATVSVPVASVFGRTGAVEATTGDYTAAKVTGSMVLAGSSTTEQTTTSLTAVDLVTISGLNIPAGTPIVIIGNMRKTSGAAAYAGVGLKLNSTVVGEAVASNSSTQLAYSSNTDRGEDGQFYCTLGARVTNYQRSGWARFALRISSTGGNASQNALMDPLYDAATPTVAITSITIRGIVANGDVTLAVKDVFIYTYPVT